MLNRATAVPTQRTEEDSAYLSRLLLRCLDVDSVWSLGHDSMAPEPQPQGHDLLLFANALTLETLRRTDALHRTDVQVLVVFDGDEIRNVWGARPVCGSLARWAWRPVGEAVAYYDESIWIEVAAARSVARRRRKAFRIWSSRIAPH
jgi:hypothetical protein